MRPQFSRVVAVVGIVAGSFLASLRPAMAQEGGGGHFDPPGPPPIVVVVRLDDVTFNANYDDGANAEAEVLLVVGVHHHG
ncbi:MAG: hypothetical protein HY721_24660, partial [Planctomycetes bacterium]|nr:hypothetical protein [Planctomycetota bacterium]